MLHFFPKYLILLITYDYFFIYFSDQIPYYQWKSCKEKNRFFFIHFFFQFGKKILVYSMLQLTNSLWFCVEYFFNKIFKGSKLDWKASFWKNYRKDFKSKVFFISISTWLNFVFNIVQFNIHFFLEVIWNLILVCTIWNSDILYDIEQCFWNSKQPDQKNIEKVPMNFHWEFRFKPFLK